MFRIRHLKSALRKGCAFGFLGGFSALMLSATALTSPASAQLYIGGEDHSVSVDWSVLDEIGQETPLPGRLAPRNSFIPQGPAATPDTEGGLLVPVNRSPTTIVNADGWHENTNWQGHHTATDGGYVSRSGLNPPQPGINRPGLANPDGGPMLPIPGANYSSSFTPPADAAASAGMYPGMYSAHSPGLMAQNDGGIAPTALLVNEGTPLPMLTAAPPQAGGSSASHQNNTAPQQAAIKPMVAAAPPESEQQPKPEEPETQQTDRITVPPKPEPTVVAKAPPKEKPEVKPEPSAPTKPAPTTSAAPPPPLTLAEAPSAEAPKAPEIPATPSASAPPAPAAPTPATATPVAETAQAEETPATPSATSSGAEQTASLPDATQASDEILTIPFESGASRLSDASRPALLDLASQLKADNNLKVQLLAYASGDANEASRARRLSLSRALTVRSFLMDQGIRSTRIEVRALGNKVEGGGQADRVDLSVEGR